MDLSIDVSLVLKSPNIIASLSLSPFMFVHLFFMYLGASMLGAYIFIIFMSSSWVDPLIIMQCSSFSLVTVFVLKFILSDISIATSAFYLFPFAWNTFFHPLTFSCVHL